MATIHGKQMKEQLSVDEMLGYDAYVHTIATHGKTELNERPQERESVEQFSSFMQEQKAATA